MRLIALLVILALPSVRAVDFTPREVKEAGEGGEYTYLRFSDAGKDVTYRPPKHWGYRGGGNLFRLEPPNVLGAEIEIVKTPLKAPLVASEESIKTFEALAVDSLPPAASKVETLSATFNPCELDGRKTVEVTIAYVLFGQPLMISRLYLPREEDMLRFTVVSKPGDFEQVRRTFQASLHTIAGL